MSSRARRFTGGTPIEPFHWLRPALADPPAPASLVDAARLPAPGIPDAMPVTLSAQEVEMRAQALEREAFAKGYAQGERAGDQVAAERAERLMRNLAATIDEVAVLRAGMLRKAERDVVRLSVAIARRVIHREVTIDHELLLAMARVAIDRLGEREQAAVHLHPVDHASAVAASNRTDDVPSCVTLVPDPHVARGGCVVRTAFGSVDLTLDAQMAELSQSLLGPELSDANLDRTLGAAAISEMARDRPAAAPPTKLESRVHKSLPVPPGFLESASAERATA